MLHQMKKSILHSVLVCQKYGKKLNLFFLGYKVANKLLISKERESTWFKKENSNRAEDIFDHPNFLMATTLWGIGQRTQKLFLSIVICFLLIIPSWNYFLSKRIFEFSFYFPFIRGSQKYYDQNSKLRKQKMFQIYTLISYHVKRA